MERHKFADRLRLVAELGGEVDVDIKALGQLFLAIGERAGDALQLARGHLAHLGAITCRGLGELVARHRLLGHVGGLVPNLSTLAVVDHRHDRFGIFHEYLVLLLDRGALLRRQLLGSRLLLRWRGLVLGAGGAGKADQQGTKKQTNEHGFGSPRWNGMPKLARHAAIREGPAVTAARKLMPPARCRPARRSRPASMRFRRPRDFHAGAWATTCPESAGCWARAATATRARPAWPSRP